MNMTKISACYTSLTVARTTAAVRSSGDNTFEMLMAIGQKDRAAQAERPQEVECASGLSRFLTMMDDYTKWKSEQTDQALPQSLGSVDADLAWLREHFSGELDVFGVIDAIESMHSMGLIDREERNSIYGIEFTVVRMTELVSCMQIRPAGYGPLWSDGFGLSPLMDLHTLDDILEWLGHRRGQSGADWTIQQVELSARRLTVTYESAEAEISAQAV